MPNAPIEVLRGTLDLLILKAASWGPSHGYAIARWIESEWGTSENNRRAKYYTLTTKGRAQLRVEAATWTRFANAIFAALEAPPQPA